MTLSPALTVRQLRDLLAECADQDAVVYIETGARLRVILDRALFTTTAETGLVRSSLVLGSRTEDWSDNHPAAEEVA